MTPSTDEQALRAALSDLTSHQPAEPPGRYQAVRERSVHIRRRHRFAAGAISAVAVAALFVGIAQLPGFLRQPQALPVRGRPEGPPAPAPLVLAASPAVKAALATEFARFEGFDARDVAGPSTGSVHYAYLPSSSVYWAIARFGPSASAPSRVQARFQTGSKLAVFARPAGSDWQVVNAPSQPACLQSAGLPVAVQRAWGLSDSPGCAPAPAASRPDAAASYHASFDVPAAWTTTPFQGSPFDRDGRTGFVFVTALAGRSSLRASCHLATVNVLHPYGTAPALSFAMLDGHQACLITPSADAPLQSIRAGGRKFASAELVVQYRVTVSGRWRYLTITCDPAHLYSIASSLRLNGGF